MTIVASFVTRVLTGKDILSPDEGRSGKLAGKEQGPSRRAVRLRNKEALSIISRAECHAKEALLESVS